MNKKRHRERLVTVSIVIAIQLVLKSKQSQLIQHRAWGIVET